MLTEVEWKIVYNHERDGDGKGPCDDARPRKKRSGGMALRANRRSDSKRLFFRSATDEGKLMPLVLNFFFSFLIKISSGRLRFVFVIKPKRRKYATQ